MTAIPHSVDLSSADYATFLLEIQQLKAEIAKKQEALLPAGEYYTPLGPSRSWLKKIDTLRKQWILVDGRWAPPYRSYIYTECPHCKTTAEYDGDFRVNLKQKRIHPVFREGRPLSNSVSVSAPNSPFVTLPTGAYISLLLEIGQLKAEVAKNQEVPLPTGGYYTALCHECLRKIDTLREQWKQQESLSADKKVLPNMTRVYTKCTHCKKTAEYDGDLEENLKQGRIHFVTRGAESWLPN
jgi:hypothetical protein